MNWQTKAVTAAVGAAAFTILRMAITKQAPAADPPDIKSTGRDDDGEHDKRNNVRAVEEQATKGQQDLTNRYSPWVYWGLLALAATLPILVWRIFGVSFSVAVGDEDISHPLGAGAFMLIAIALPALLLRGPEFHHSRSLLFCAYLLFLLLLSLLMASLYFLLSNYSANDPATEIELALIGLIGLGVVLSTAASWVDRWPLAEPIALGIISVALGAICIPGLRDYTQLPSVRDDPGSAHLFATGKTTQPLSFSVTYGSSESFQTLGESFQIKNVNGAGPVNWALLIVGDARDPDLVHDVPRTVRSMSLDTRGREQLLWGTLKPGKSAAFALYSTKDFCTSRGPRSVCMLPEYGEGNIGDLDPSARTSVLKALNGNPATRGPQLATKVVSYHTPLESMVVAIPAADERSSVKGAFQWTSNNAIEVQYLTAPQQGDDPTTNALFIYAVLLGAAGGGLITSIQGIISASRAQASERRKKRSSGSKS